MDVKLNFKDSFPARTSLLEFVDFSELQQLCEKFTDITNAVTAVLDLEGNVVIATGWKDICTCFHRIHPITESRCKESDTTLASQLGIGKPYNVYKCKNGLVDVAVPIIIAGECVAYFFTGQFFFEKPDQALFIQQAEEFGFDKNAYLDALSKVPIFSEEYIKKVLDFLSCLVHMIGMTGLSRKQLEETNQQLLQDAAERKREKEALQVSEERLRLVLEGSRLGFWDWNVLTGEVQRNRQWAEMLGYTFDEIQSTTNQWADFLHPEDLANAWESINNHLAGKTFVHEMEYRMLTKDGSYKWIQDRAMVTIRDHEGKPLRMSGTHTDITDRKNVEAKLTYWSNHDNLTGLYNRTYFDAELCRAACGSRFPIGIIVADLDNLKQVNDTLGHVAGDWLIKSAATILEGAFSREDVIARTGGDEYVIIVYGVDDEALSASLSKIRSREERFNQEHYGPKVKISLGAAIATSGEEIQDVLKKADDAMYANKRLRKSNLAVRS